MISRRHRVLSGLAARLNLGVQPVADKAWLVQRLDDSTPAMSIDRVDRKTWVIQRRRGPRRTLRQVGPPRLRAHLLVDARAAHADMKKFQQKLSDYLAAEHIVWMLRALRANCVLDVGANKGQYAQGLRKAGYTGRIVSFEPLAHLVGPLREAAKDDPEWLVVDCALGDEEGEAEINVVPGKMSSMLESSAFGKGWSPKLQEMYPETIQIRRLEDFMDEATAGIQEPRIYLKMDTQGYDLKAFRGAGDRIGEILGMQSEVACVPIYDGMPRLPEQVTEYESAGFEITGMFPVTRHAKTLRVIEFDMVMLRTAAMAPE